MSDEPAPQRYLMVTMLLDPDQLATDGGDLLHDLENVICDEDADDHDCPLITMSSRGFDEDQLDMLLASNAEELRAAGWAVLSPAEKELARRVGPVVYGAPARPYRRPRGQS